MIRAFAIVAVLAAVLPAQNLLTVEGWKPGPENPSFIKSFSSTSKWLAFNPMSNPGSQWTCVSQEVNTTGGLYQVNFSGSSGSTGSFRFQIIIDETLLVEGINEGRMTFTKAVFLKADKHLVKFRSKTSDLNVDYWYLHQPTLTPAVAPTTYVFGYYGGAYSGSEVRLSASTEANLLAISMHKVVPPIKIPGIGHGLELAPSTLLIIATSSSVKTISVSFRDAMHAAKISQWPSFYMQAATWTQFGSLAHIVE